MRLIAIRIEPSLPRFSAEDLGAVLAGAGVHPEHVYLDVAGSTTQIGLYVRCEVADLGSTTETVIEALTPLAGEDRLIRAQAHSWVLSTSEPESWW